MSRTASPAQTSLSNSKNSRTSKLSWLRTDHFQPANIVEQILVEKMAQNQWLSLRAVSIQGMALKHTIANGCIQKDLGVLIRYQVASDRAFHKAHAELVKAQKERKMSEIGFESKKSAEPADIPVKSPQNPPAVPEKPLVRTFTAAAQTVFVPDSGTLATQLDAGGAKLAPAA